MRRRDASLFLGFAVLSAILFRSLLLSPAKIPGNFGDLYSYHYPLRHLVAATLQEGRLPLWNPYIFAGLPLAANSQAVLLYPLSLPHYFFPLAWSFSVEDFAHVLLAGLGAWLLLRKWRIDSAGACLFAASYALSPFVVCRIAQGVPTHLHALSWCPWIWLAAQSSSLVWFALCLALQVLSGHPQFCLINLGGLALFAAVRRPAVLRRLFAAGLLATCLIAIQAFPTLQFLGRSVRSIWNPSLAVDYSLNPLHLLTFVYPNAFGNPFRPDFGPYPSEFFEMLTNYIGWIPLILGIYGSLRLRISWLLAGVGFFFALGQYNPLYVPLQRVLGLDFLRTPSRFSFLVLWGLWLAAAAEWKRLRPWLPAALAAALTAAAALDVAAWSSRWIYPQDPARFIAANPDAVATLRRGGGRFATDPDNLTPNKSMQYRLYNATGYEAFYPAPIALYTSRSERAPSADGSRTYIRDWRTPAMSKLSVRYYVTTQNVPGAIPVFRQGDARIYENPKAEPWVQEAPAWDLLSPEHWKLRLNVPGSVLISQAMYPGWKAWANGRPLPVSVEDGLFPRLAAPTGIPGPPWVVHFRFLPGLWTAGALASIAGLAGCGVLLAREFRLERSGA